jgi:hypothetical protein
VLRAIIRIASILVLCALSSLAASGQTNVTNPKVVEFDPSADHSTLTADGQPMVSRYDLQIFLQGATLPITTTRLGKPAADADGKLRVDFSAILIGWPLANGTYQARVAAIGPTGSGQSDPSNLFDFQAGVIPSCSFTLSSSAGSLSSGSGSSSVTLTASATTCGWTAASNSAWATVAPASGTGSGTVSVTVAANPGAARTATVTLGGQTYTVTQAAAPPPCSFTLSPTSVSVSGAAGTSTVSLTASASTCRWTASTANNWITIGTASGTGSASVSYSVSRNYSGDTRTGTMTAGGKVVTVTQASVPRPSRPRGLTVR